jgi:hypothetical protein
MPRLEQRPETRCTIVQYQSWSKRLNLFLCTRGGNSIPATIVTLIPCNTDGTQTFILSKAFQAPRKDAAHEN